MSIRSGSRVKMTKIAKSANPKYETADWEEYQFGQSNVDKSIPIEYEVEGQLVAPVASNYPIQIFRHKRNGKAVMGMMLTSRIQSISKNLAEDGRKINSDLVIETENSIYILEEI